MDVHTDMPVVQRSEGVTEGIESGKNYVGGVPTTPDPNVSAKASRYKWEAYRDTNWVCICYFLPKEGHTFPKVSR